VYAAIAIAFTWPLAAHIGDAFPHDPYDPALTTWILWWNAHAVPLTARWWNAPMFWPLPGALALSEHLLGISLLDFPGKRNLERRLLGVPSVIRFLNEVRSRFGRAPLVLESSDSARPPGSL